MADRIVVIANPEAGSRIHVDRLKKELTSLGDYSLKITTRSGEATDLAREAVDRGATLVVAVGGDGTIHEVVNGLGQAVGRCSLGIIPAGTGNDTARSLEIPFELGNAVERLAVGRVRPIDLIEIRQHEDVSYAVNAVTGGFGGVVNEEMTGEVRDFWGSLAYVRAAAQIIPRPPAYDVELAIDDAPSRSFRAVSIVVANGEYAAHGLPVAPRALMDDGKLSVHLILESTPAELMVLATSILRREIPDHGNYLHWECERVSVSARGRLPLSADGELMQTERISYRILPSHLRIVGVA